MTFCFIFIYLWESGQSFSHDFLRGVLWTRYPLDQKETDVASRLTSEPGHCGQVIWRLGTRASSSVEWSLRAACPCLRAHGLTELELHQEASSTKTPGAVLMRTATAQILGGPVQRDRYKPGGRNVNWVWEEQGPKLKLLKRNGHPGSPQFKHL